MKPMKSIDSNRYQFYIKKCRVCGDVASGFNFNGLCCDSCKAFFRRNAVKSYAFECRRNSAIECDINLRNRKYCRKCRLQKCYDIGMKREMIVCIQKLMNIQDSTLSEENFSTDDIKDDFMIRSILPDEIYDIQLDVTSLQQYDLECLKEIQNAQQHFKDVYSLEMVGRVQSLAQVIKIAEFYVVKIIKFCKSFTAFKSLKLDDQMIILKGFHPEISAIRVAFLYNSQKDGFPVIADATETKTLFVRLDWRGEIKNKKIVNSFRKFLLKIQLEMENDSTIQGLILSQLLFNQRDNIDCTEFLKFNHTIYTHLLGRYLLHKHRNVPKAEEKYSRLMQMLTHIEHVAQLFRQIYQNEVDRSVVPRVLAEIYNL